MSAIKYGLVGHPVEHSLSPFIHREILAAASLPGDYELYDIKPDDLATVLPPLISEFKGLNCTLPHKEAVIPYLDSLDDTAGRCLAVNTIFRNRGYNTDYLGFLADCPEVAASQVLILGAGGVSRTMALAAADSGAIISILARRNDQACQLAKSIQKQKPDSQVFCPRDFAKWLERTEKYNKQGETRRKKVLLNGTPLGLWPQTAGIPLEPDNLANFDFVYDTIYNPVSTRLVLQARSRGIKAKSGLGMLFAQALAAQKIWNPDLHVEQSALRSIRSKLAMAVSRAFPTLIILTGFMGSGKSTIGKMLAESVGLPFADLDQEIEEGEKCTIPDIFSNLGERAFRNLEQKYLQKQFGAGGSLILASGGGTIQEPEAERIIRSKAALVVNLDTPLEEILQRVGEGRGRPMIYQQGEARLRQLYEQRRPGYLQQADLVVRSADRPEIIVKKLVADLGFGGG